MIDFIPPVFVTALDVDECENIEGMDIQNARGCQRGRG